MANQNAKRRLRRVDRRHQTRGVRTMSWSNVATKIATDDNIGVSMKRQSKTALLKLAAKADPRTSHGFGAGMGYPFAIPSVHVPGDVEVNYVFSCSPHSFISASRV